LLKLLKFVVLFQNDVLLRGDASRRGGGSGGHCFFSRFCLISQWHLPLQTFSALSAAPCLPPASLLRWRAPQATNVDRIVGFGLLAFSLVVFVYYTLWVIVSVILPSRVHSPCPQRSNRRTLPRHSAFRRRGALHPAVLPGAVLCDRHSNCSTRACR
jgi:hypothetical protein